MSVNFGFSFPALAQYGGGGNNPFGQLGPTLDMSFVDGATGVTNLNDPNGYTLTTNFITPEYQVAAQYTIWETNVGLVSKTFADIITFTRASSATFVGSNGLIQSATTNTPRFDYDPVTLAAKGLLIEEQRTNLFTYSEQFDNAAWNKNNATVTANAAVSPDGTTTAESLTATTNTAYVSSNVNYAVTSYQISVYVKAGTGNVVWLYVRSSAENGIAYFDLSDLSTQAVAGTFSTPSNLTITSVGSGWYRVSATFNNGVALVSGSGIGVADAKGSLNATSGKSIFIWGAQLEAGSFATSYIPTVASQVTRSDDRAVVNTLSPWFNATEGTVYTEASSIYGTSGLSYVVSAFDDGTNSNRISTRRNENAIAYGVDTGGINQVTLTTSFVASNLATFKVASAYKLDDFAASFNGAAALTDTLGTVPTGLVALRLGYPASTSGGQRFMSGHIRRITYYPRRLSNAELVSITS